MQQFDRFLGRVRNRPEYMGRAVRPEAQVLDGFQCEFEVLWLMNDHDPYPGEFAVQPVDDSIRREWYSTAKVMWIAQGDVEVLRPSV